MWGIFFGGFQQRYDLNQISYDCRRCDKWFQGIRYSRVPEELWMKVHNTVQEAVTKSIPEKKKCNKAKWLSEEKRTEAKAMEEKKYIYTHLNSEFQRTARRD